MGEITNSFVFYKSFYDAMAFLENDDKCRFITLICELAFNGTEADLTDNGLSDLVKMLYTVSAEQIKASIKNKINGSKGGYKKGVNTPLNTPLNSGVNSNVNVKEKDNDKENVNTPFTFLNITIENVTKWAELNTKFKHYAKSLENIEKVTNYLKSENLPISYLDYVFTRCLEKYDKNDINFGLITNALDWYTNDYKRINKPKETKTIKVKKPAAPKTCSFCGSKLKLGGILNSWECPNCNPRTWWELVGNEWKCSRD